MEKVARVWKKLHNKELRELHFTPIIDKAITQGWYEWALWHGWERGDATGFIIGKVEGKRTLWRSRLMEENITVRTALFWVITLRVVVTSYRRFRTTNRVPSSVDSCPLKKGQTGCPETSVINNHYSQRNNSEQHSSHLLRGGSLTPKILRRILNKQGGGEWVGCTCMRLGISGDLF
jgi:hypothetical protein